MTTRSELLADLKDGLEAQGLHVETDAYVGSVRPLSGKRGLTPLTGGDPDARYPVPSESEFEAGFCEGADIKRIAGALIEQCPELDHLNGLTVSYWWKWAKGSKGCKFWGKASKPTGLVEHFTNAAFLIVLNAKGCSGLTTRQVEALVYHELRHCELDDETLEPVMVEHDWAGFRQEIERFGLWAGDEAHVAEAFQQLRLPE